MNRCAIYNEVAARIQGNNKVSERIKLQLWGADIAIAHARNVERVSMNSMNRILLNPS
jgi:hypothetical protein